MLDRLDVKYFKLAVGMDAIGKESEVDISARCPVCGDSRTKKNSKRLHLYTKDGTSGHVNCFNGDCPVHNKTVYSFLRDFYPALLPQYKRENFGNTMEKLAKGDTEDVFGNFKNEEEPKEKEVLIHDLTPYLKNIEEVPEALAYLENRGIHYKESKFGKWYFGYQDLKIGETLYKITNAIVIPLYYNDEMYGFYSRSILDKTFYTYMHDANIGYKVWNWFNIKKDQPVFIYEGIFDAIAGGLPNSIALMGAKLPDDRLAELKDPVFVLDDDKTGHLNSISYAEKGHKVYVQPNGYKKDMNENLLQGVDTTKLVLDNLYTGISAVTRIKAKL